MMAWREHEHLRHSLNRMGKMLITLATCVCALKTVRAQSRNLERKLMEKVSAESQRVNQIKERQHY